MTDWTPPEAMVEAAALEIKKLVPLEYGMRIEEARSYARAALAASPIRELVEALEELWEASAAPEWGGDLSYRRYVEAGTKTKAALARARGETK